MQLLHFKTQRFKRIGKKLTFLCLVGIQLAIRVTVEAAYPNVTILVLTLESN